MPTFNQEKIAKLKKIDKSLKRFFFFRSQNDNLPFDKENTKSIVIIGFLLIGDTLMFLPALRTIRQNFPLANITLIGTKAVKIITENQDVIDNFIVVDCPWIGSYDKSIKNLFNFANGILIANRAKKYDIAIEFRGDWRNIFYMNFLRAKRKVSYNYTGGEYMLTDILVPNPNIDHFTDESFYFLEQIGCHFTNEDKIPYLKKDEATFKTQAEFFTEHNIKNRFIVGLHPGASQIVKQWDVVKYSELIQMMSTVSSDLLFLIFEGPGEQQTVADLKNQLESQSIPFIIVKRNLRDYIDIIGICNLMICNDSGAAHVAAAFAIPIVVIFANVDPKYVTPKSIEKVKVISHSLTCKPCFNSICKFNSNECINSVELDEVYTEVIDILNEKLLQRK